MRKKLKSILVIIIIFIFTYLTINKSILIKKSIEESINIFIKNIVPSILPMFIISNMLISIGIPKFLSNIFNKLFYILFKTKPISSFIFFLSMLTGSFSNAKYINDLNLNNKDSEKILLFTYFTNPLFIINTIGMSLFNSKIIGLKMFISHILSNIFIGIIFRNYNKSVLINEEKKNLKENLKDLNNNIYKSNLLEVLLYSLKSSIDILLNILVIISFFNILINILNIGNGFISGIIELTNGINIISKETISYNKKIYQIMFLISFGGLSIHTQIYNILNKKKVKYLPFLLARIIHGVISIIILKILL